MKLYLVGHQYQYAVEQMMMTLFPGQKPEYPHTPPTWDQSMAQVELFTRGHDVVAHAKLWWDGGVYEAQRSEPLSHLTGGLEDDRVRQRIVRLAFYDAGVAALGQEPPWGALTGVRPVKLPTRQMAAGDTPEQARDTLTSLYRSALPGRTWPWTVPTLPCLSSAAWSPDSSPSMWAFPSAPPGAPTAPSSPPM